MFLLYSRGSKGTATEEGVLNKDFVVCKGFCLSEYFDFDLLLFPSAHAKPSVRSLEISRRWIAYLCVHEQLASGLSILEQAAIGDLEVKTPLRSRHRQRLLLHQLSVRCGPLQTESAAESRAHPH
jgi:hypothetical protein